MVEYTNVFSPAFKPEEKEGVNPSPACAVVRSFNPIYIISPYHGLCLQRLGGCLVIDPDKAIDEAVALAAASDVVVYIGGLTPEWELEGFDRPTLALPERQNELIEKLGKANRNTVVVLQAVRYALPLPAVIMLTRCAQGSAVGMPWVNNVNGILQAWYSGNEGQSTQHSASTGTIYHSPHQWATLWRT